MNSIYSSRPVATSTPRRWSAAATSGLIHAALVLLVMLVGRAADMLPEPATEHLTFVSVAPPDPPPLPRPPVRLPPIVKEVVKHEPAVPLPEIEKPPEPEIARVEPPRPAPEPVVVERPKPAPPVVQVGVFASARNDEAPQPSRAVQQAGFDQVETRGSGVPMAKAVVGGFDQGPAGQQRPGYGRATGIADAGFANGTAAGPSGPPGNGRVAAGGFDTGAGSTGPKAVQAVKTTDFDARAEQAAAPKAARQAPVEVPVEILSKPTPAYTDEARALKIEGEVALEVEFAATGEIRVLKVVRSLGHGLDECAARAVQGMRFKPATRHGQVIDFRTTVTIVFRLA